MNSIPPIQVKNLSKLYLLYKRPQDRLKQSILGRLGKNYAQTFWALRNISFEVQAGETLGIIGRNGSGKSTLLQIVAGILQPSEGTIQVNGRLAALLELGAGFNPEFTGRENIFLNGVTLGLTEKAVRQKLDAIIDFAGIGEFIDQPVKIYSSGMFVRLAFAIATSVEPAILIVDEALAVGDAGFVLKCMNRMKQLREQGTTILLVTHDVQTVRSFCDRVLWLNEGKLVADGEPLDISSRYLQFLFGDEESQVRALEQKQAINLETTTFVTNQSTQGKNFLHERNDLTRWGSGELLIESCQLYSDKTRNQSVFEYGDWLHITIRMRARQNLESKTLGAGIALRNIKGLDVITSTTLEQKHFLPPLKAGQAVQITFSVPNILAPGDYALVVNTEHRDKGTPTYFDFIENAVVFKVVSKFEIFSLVLPEVVQAIRLTPEDNE